MAAPYGPARVRKITPAFAARALTGAPIEVYGDGEQVSDMVHVRDVARTMVNALEHAAAGDIVPRVVEVGPVTHHTVNEVAAEVIASATALGYPAVDIKHLPMRPGETPGAYVTAGHVDAAAGRDRPGVAGAARGRHRGDGRVVRRALAARLPRYPQRVSVSLPLLFAAIVALLVAMAVLLAAVGRSRR
jgi:hypothetical protein